jgi:hypothetical protein
VEINFSDGPNRFVRPATEELLADHQIVFYLTPSEFSLDFTGNFWYDEIGRYGFGFAAAQ